MININKDIYKKIFKLIKKYDEIVLARHIGPDPDAVASQIALRDSIKLTFPNKRVYAVGAGVSKFKYLGSLDKPDFNSLTNSLLIVLDVPNFYRIDGADDLDYKDIVKIDHHPKEDIIGTADFTSSDYSSTCEMVANLIYETKLVMDKDIAEKLIEKMIKAANARQAARKAKEQARKGKNNREAKFLSGKLAPAQSKNKRKNELYLVEGDSAGGSAKQGRDRKFQAILPLRGKVINTEKATQADILKNEEISTMINTINAGVGADFNADDSAYDKIIIMTDADTDGAHIQILLLTFFYRYMRDLIKAGKVYIAMPPLYKVSKKSGKKDNVIYCWDEKDLEAARKKMGRGYDVQRYKGLGEMNAEQLWETTMNPETRTLIQVTIDDAAIVERSVSVLMGDKVQPRREWIENNVQFSLEDSFFMEG